MKLIFSKDEQQEISVSTMEGDEVVEFNYVDMIKSLISTKCLEESEVNGDFSEPEQVSIHSMIKHINGVVAEFYLEDEE